MKPVFESYLLGLATPFDLAGTLSTPQPRLTPNPAEADWEALHAAWEAVRQDMWTAFTQVSSGQGQAQESIW